MCCRPLTSQSGSIPSNQTNQPPTVVKQALTRDDFIAMNFFKRKIKPSLSPYQLKGNKK